MMGPGIWPVRGNGAILFRRRADARLGGDGAGAGWKVL